MVFINPVMKLVQFTLYAPLVNNWDVKMYWFLQFCMWFSVLIEFLSVFRFWMILSTVLRFLMGPNAPLL